MHRFAAGFLGAHSGRVGVHVVAAAPPSFYLPSQQENALQALIAFTLTFAPYLVFLPLWAAHLHRAMGPSLLSPLHTPFP